MAVAADGGGRLRHGLCRCSGYAAAGPHCTAGTGDDRRGRTAACPRCGVDASAADRGLYTGARQCCSSTAQRCAARSAAPGHGAGAARAVLGRTAYRAGPAARAGGSDGCAAGPPGATGCDCAADVDACAGTRGKGGRWASPHGEATGTGRRTHRYGGAGVRPVRHCAAVRRRGRTGHGADAGRLAAGGAGAVDGPHPAARLVERAGLAGAAHAGRAAHRGDRCLCYCRAGPAAARADAGRIGRLLRCRPSARVVRRAAGVRVAARRHPARACRRREPCCPRLCLYPHAGRADPWPA